MELGDLLSLVFVAIVVLSVLSNIFSRGEDEPADPIRPTDLNESGRTGERPAQQPVRRTGQPVVTSERGAGTQGRMPQTVVTREADGAGRGRMPQTVTMREADGAGRGRMPQTVVDPVPSSSRDTVSMEGLYPEGRSRMGRDVTVSADPASNREQVRDRSGRDRTLRDRDEWVERASPEEIARRALQAAERATRRRADDVPMDGEIGSRRRRPAAAGSLGAASPTMLLRRSLRDQTTVRRAFVVKELLDRPVGLREEA